MLQSLEHLSVAIVAVPFELIAEGPSAFAAVTPSISAGTAVTVVGIVVATSCST